MNMFNKYTQKNIYWCVQSNGTPILTVCCVPRAFKAFCHDDGLSHNHCHTGDGTHKADRLIGPRVPIDLTASQ